MNWFPLKNFTHYSLLKGFSKPHELAKMCADNDYPACGITDYKSISGAVSFHQACKKVGIKPIIGCSFDSTTVYAKNKDGWHDLIKMVSMTDENGNMPTDIAKDIIFGQLRLVVAMMDIEEINADRDKFLSNVSSILY